MICPFHWDLTEVSIYVRPLLLIITRCNSDRAVFDFQYICVEFLLVPWLDLSHTGLLHGHKTMFILVRKILTFSKFYE